MSCVVNVVNVKHGHSLTFTPIYIDLKVKKSKSTFMQFNLSCSSRKEGGRSNNNATGCVLRLRQNILLFYLNIFPCSPCALLSFSFHGLASQYGAVALIN